MSYGEQGDLTEIQRRLQTGLNLGHQIGRERAPLIVQLGPVERCDLVAQCETVPRKPAGPSG